MKRLKNGYAMAMVVVTMAVVMALSSLVLMLVATTNSNQKIQFKNLEANLYVSEISTAYASKNLSDFVQYCENKSWTSSSEENVTTLTSSENIYTITITQNGVEENFNFVQTKTQKILAQLHKTNNAVDEWHYEIKE